MLRFTNNFFTGQLMIYRQYLTAHISWEETRYVGTRVFRWQWSLADTCAGTDTCLLDTCCTMAQCQCSGLRTRHCHTPAAACRNMSHVCSCQWHVCCCRWHVSQWHVSWPAGWVRPCRWQHCSAHSVLNKQRSINNRSIKSKFDALPGDFKSSLLLRSFSVWSLLSLTLSGSWNMFGL